MKHKQLVNDIDIEDGSSLVNWIGELLDGTEKNRSATLQQTFCKIVDINSFFKQFYCTSNNNFIRHEEPFNSCVKYCKNRIQQVYTKSS